MPAKMQKQKNYPQISQITQISAGLICKEAHAKLQGLKTELPFRKLVSEANRWSTRLKVEALESRLINELLYRRR
ncbi:MAG: hypothetical protein CVV42_05845 [Candidatus Riflebacteria bacterium HGW-Riflebacteria-2]|nr:MAG: hypothetical protein CVV42_05845 [Candidatus Riflebacteria bacterium HGW-Riflebacteria-2]